MLFDPICLFVCRCLPALYVAHLTTNLRELQCFTCWRAPYSWPSHLAQQRTGTILFQLNLSGLFLLAGPGTTPQDLRILGVGVGWVGWGDDNVPCTCTHVECYATGCFSRTCTHVECYATGCFSRTCTHVEWYATGCFSRTCAHVECYATGCFSRTCTHVWCYATCVGWVGWGGDSVPCTCTHVECYATGCTLFFISVFSRRRFQMQKFHVFLYIDSCLGKIAQFINR